MGRGALNSKNPQRPRGVRSSRLDLALSTPLGTLRRVSFEQEISVVVVGRFDSTSLADLGIFCVGTG